MSKLILAVFLLIHFVGIKNLYAQYQPDSIPYIGDDIIKQGIKLYDDGKYKEALKVFEQVSPCDPNYSKACYEMAFTYDNLGDYTTAFQMCKEAIALDSTDIQTFIMKGNLLDKLGRGKEAIEWLKFVEKTYPYHQSLLYNLGICYLNAGDIQKAEAILIKGIHYNPYHAKSHLALAKINYIMGRTAQSYLAYNMGIIMSPRLDYINSFEESISGNIDSISKSYLYPYPGSVNRKKWDILSGLLNSEVAFREDFPYEYKLSFLTCKQSVLLFRKMEFDDKDTSLYNQFYVRFFKKVVEENDLETYLYYTLKSSGNEQVTEWYKKNEALNNAFVDRAKQKIEDWKSYGFSTTNEANHQKIYHFNDEGDLENVGILKENEQPSKVGLWYSVNGTGVIVEKGNYIDNKQEGEFLKYWSDGSIRQKLNFKNDKLDGMNYTFHVNGVKSGVFPRNYGTPDGVQEEYNTAGKLFSRIHYNKGHIEGTTLFIDYPNGFRRETPYVNNKCEGMMTEYWLNGIKKTEAMYADSVLNGSFKKWYANGKAEWEGFYTKGINTGRWISYHPNGVKSAEGRYDESGKTIDTYTEYDYRGKMTSRISGYSEGEPNGTQTYYFPDGTVQARLILENGTLKHMEYFDLAGKQLYMADESNGELYFKSFFPEGPLKTEGLFKNGLKTGPWKDYNVLGKLINELNWNQGYQSGIQKQYFPNGNLELVFVCDSNKVLGEVKRYYKNGHLSFKGYYDAEGPAGLWSSYYSNDSIENLAYLVNGKMVGKRMSYSPDSKLSMEEVFDQEGECLSVKYFSTDGKAYSVTNFSCDSTSYVFYYPNGKLKAKLSYIDRKRHGPQENYYPNGRLKWQKSYIYGNAEGECREWDHQGNPIEVKTYRINKLDGKYYGYDNGKLGFLDHYDMGIDNGLYLEFYPNGHRKRSYETTAGLRQGSTEYTAPDSTWMYSVQYRDDEICAVTYLDKSGNLHSNERVDSSTKEIVCYYKSGKVAACIPMDNGLFKGKYSTYYPNGQLMAETSYVDDYRQGLARQCFENGSVRELCNWNNGSRHGNYTLYFSNGKKAMEGEYREGKKHGKWLCYNETGKLVETLSYADDEVYEIN